jgi:hypothetical protein
MTANNEQDRSRSPRRDAPSLRDSRIGNDFRRALVSHLPHLRAIATAPTISSTTPC